MSHAIDLGAPNNHPLYTHTLLSFIIDFRVPGLNKIPKNIGREGEVMCVSLVYSRESQQNLKLINSRMVGVRVINDV